MISTRITRARVVIFPLSRLDTSGFSAWEVGVIHIKLGVTVYFNINMNKTYTYIIFNKMYDIIYIYSDIYIYIYVSI